MTLLLTLDDGSVHRKLAAATGLARAAVQEEAPDVQVGVHVGVNREDAVTVSHLFEAAVPGYRGWRWSVTIALATEDEEVTISEVVLVPGPEALIAPAWVPWERRVRAGDLGVGDIFPTDRDDARLSPGYIESDDPAVEEVALEAGLGRVHVLSRVGRQEAADRWHGGEFGPRSDMARSAPGVCGTCGFFVPLAGSLRATFGACTNDIAPADGHVVDVEYGCGAHSEVEVEITSSIPVAELVYDDSLLDFTSAPDAPDAPETSDEAEPATDTAESAVAPVESAQVDGAAAVEAEPGEVREVGGPEVASATEVAEPAVAPVEPEQVDGAAAVVAEPSEAQVEPEQVDESVAAAVVPEPGEAQAAAEPEDVAASATDTVTAEPGEAQVAEKVAEEPPAVEETESRDADAAAEVAESVQAVAPDAAVESEGVAAAESGEAEKSAVDVAESREGEAAAEVVSAEPVALLVEPVQVEESAADVTESREGEAATEAVSAEPVALLVEPVQAEESAAAVTETREGEAATEAVSAEPVALLVEPVQVEESAVDVAESRDGEAATEVVSAEPVALLVEPVQAEESAAEVMETREGEAVSAEPGDAVVDTDASAEPGVGERRD